MTNGEKIQKDFQGCEVCEPIVEDDIIHVIFADKKDSAIGFDWSWWNAEYKEPTIQERQAEIDKLDAAFQDGYDPGYAQARFDYEQEPTIKNDLANDVPDINVGKIKPVIRDNQVKDELNRVKDELEPTTENCESCKYYGSHHEVCNYCYKCSLWTEKEPIIKNDLAQERYQDLIEYFGGENTVLKDRKEFKAWLERHGWHVKRADELAREFGQLRPTTKDCLAVEQIVDEVIDKVMPIISKDMPSVTPQLSSELVKNSKKLEKDFGELINSGLSLN